MKNFLRIHFDHFWPYFSIQLKYFIPYYLFVVTGMAIVVSALSYLYIVSSPDIVKNIIVSSFWTFINIGGVIITTSAFSPYGNDNTRIHMLLIPISPLTRFLTILIYAIPGCLIVLVIFYTLMANGLAKVYSTMDFVKDFAFNPFKPDKAIDNNTLVSHLMFFIMLQSLTLMAGSFFTKMGLLKTILAFIGLLLFYLLINKIPTYNSLDAGFTTNLYNILTTNNSENLQLRAVMPVTTWFWWILGCTLIPLSWYVSFLRCKEMVA